jgi:hypothetical protein
MNLSMLMKLLTSTEVTNLLNKLLEQNGSEEKIKLKFINLLLENMDDEGKVEVKIIMQKLTKSASGSFNDEEYGVG